jgi:sugar phosphate isomerase/epimerase
MNQISFMSANFVARQLSYQMTAGWMQGDRATQEYFRPVETFGERFAALLGEIKALGFGALDLWLAHLHPHWATAEHVALAREQLAQHQLTVTSLAGGFGNTAAEAEASCRLATALGTTILGGNSGLLHTDRPTLIAILQTHGCRLGIENHPEKTPQELLDQIGDAANNGHGAIGACVDTGWFGTQGFDSVLALAELRDHLLHIHLKDVLAAGAHHTCRYGRGIVPIRACVRTLERIGYTGPLSVEHEPETFDPTEDCKANLRLLKRWLAGE